MRAVLLCTLALIIGCETTELPTVEVERGLFVVDVGTRGELAAVESRTVSRPRDAGGQAAIVQLAPEGEVVEEGDFLVQFDTNEAERNVVQKQGALENARAKLAATRAQASSRMAEIESSLRSQEYTYELAQLRFDQMQYEAEARRREQELELRKAELSLEEAKERIDSQRTVDKANLRTAEIEVEQAETELKRAEDALAKQTIDAPLGGLVVYMTIWKSGGRGKVAVGDSPWPGQEILEIPDLSEMMARTKVDEVDINRIAVGQPATITVDALDGLALKGEVTRVATLAKQQRGETAKTFDVEILLTDHDERLRPGMSVQTEIEVERQEDALSVPLEAVFEDEGRTIVWPAGSQTAREVELGSRSDDRVRIVEGVDAGDRLILRDPNQPLPEVGEDLPGGNDAPAR